MSLVSKQTASLGPVGLLLSVFPLYSFVLLCNKCLCRIMGYRWNDFVSNQLFVRET